MKSTTSALRNTVLCLLALQNPRNFKDGSPTNLSTDFFSSLANAERLHIFPVGYLKQKQITASEVHWLPNFIFIPGELNREISNQAPSLYLAEYRLENPSFDVDIKTHLIPLGKESGIWTDDYRKFLQQRADFLAERLNQLLETGPTTSFESTDLIGKTNQHQWIESIELQLRDLINERLNAVAGDSYWDQTVPTGVQNKVLQKIGHHVTEHPYISAVSYASGRKKLDFCDVSDYIGIIKGNWSQFSELLGNQDNALRHLDDFRKFRNLVAHNNTEQLTVVMHKNAEAAILWLQAIFDANLANEDE